MLLLVKLGKQVTMKFISNIKIDLANPELLGDKTESVSLLRRKQKKE